MSKYLCAAVVGALTAAIAGLGAASAADAATIYACQKKKGGTIRIVSAKTKCKKSEKKFSFNTTGKAGKDGSNGKDGANGAAGTNGTNGTNGSNGADGEPRSALSFSVTRDLSSTNDTLFSAGGVTAVFNCRFIFIANGASIQVSGASGTYQGGMVAQRTDASATQTFQPPVQFGTLSSTPASIATIVTNSSGTISNEAHVTGSIKTPSSVVLIDAYIQVAPSGASACIARGHALVLPAA